MEWNGMEYTVGWMGWNGRKIVRTSYFFKKKKKKIGEGGRMGGKRGERKERFCFFMVFFL